MISFASPTVMLIVLSIPAKEAVITTSPSLTPRTRPLGVTVATVSSLDVKTGVPYVVSGVTE